MSKKKKPEIETDLRSLLPEEVHECSLRLAGLIEAHKSIKQKAKVAARDFKTQLEANEEEQERLSRMIITQQEEVPVKRQMTLAEIEDQRRHELSLEQFKQAGDASVSAPATVDDLILQFEKRRSIPTREIGAGDYYKVVMEAAGRRLTKEHENVSGDGYEIRLTKAGSDQLKRLIEARKKKRKPKAAPASAPEPIANNGDVVEADPLDLVPDDRRNRTWRDLPEWELTQWQTKLINKRGLAGVLDSSKEAEIDAYLERIKAEIERRGETWSKADAAGGD